MCYSTKIQIFHQLNTPQVVNSYENRVSNFGKMTVSPMLNIGRVWLG